MLKVKYNFNLLAVKFIRKTKTKKREQNKKRITRKENIKNKLIFTVKITNYINFILI